MAVKTQVDLLQNRRTKIIATIGPASADEKVLTELMLSGVNIFRLNMSHGHHEGRHANAGINGSQFKTHQGGSYRCISCR